MCAGYEKIGLVDGNLASIVVDKTAQCLCDDAYVAVIVSAD